MNLDSVLKQDPYNFTADTEYYDKGYRGIVGVPGRVLQAKEITALSMYPIYALSDLASHLFTEGVVQGMDFSNDAKTINGSIFGATTEVVEELSELKVYDIDDLGNETEISVNLSGLTETVIDTGETEEEETEDDDSLSEVSVEDDDDTYKVVAIKRSGSDSSSEAFDVSTGQVIVGE